MVVTMNRTLTVAVPLPPSGEETVRDRFEEDAGAWLAENARRLPDAWQAEVRLGRLRQPVVATVGPAWTVGDTTWRTLRWTPVRDEGLAQVDDRRLPSFAGHVGLRRRNGRMHLVLRGAYEPPAGRLGSVVDSLLLHKVAEVTAQQLATEIADRLSRPDPDLLALAGADSPPTPAPARS